MSTVVETTRRRTPSRPSAIDADGHRLRLRGRGHRQDDGHRRALRAGRRARRRRRLDPRRHVHRARGGRAAIAHPRAARQCRPHRSRARARRRVDLDHPRLLPQAAPRLSRRRRASTRASACSTRARRACCAPRRSASALAEFCAGEHPDATVSCSRRTAPAVSAACSAGVAETLRAAGRPLELELERGAGSRRPGSPSCSAAAAGQRSRRRRRTRRQDEARASRSPAPLELLDGSPPSTSCSISRRSPSRAAARSASPRTRTARSRSSRRRSTSPPCATATCSRSCSSSSATRTRRAKDAESALDFEDLQLRARDLLSRRRGRTRQRAPALPVDHGRRVPGHEPAAVRDRRPVRSGGALLRRRRVPVDLPLPARGRRGLQGAPRAVGGRAAAAGELPLPTRAARRGQRALRSGLRRRLTSRSWPQDASRIPPRARGRAARHRQAELQGTRAAPGAAAKLGRPLGGYGSSATRERPTPGEVVFLFAAGTDAERLRGGAARRRPADVPRRGPRLLRAAAGARRARVPAAAAQPLRRRGARRRARLAARRRVERRARAASARGQPSAALHRARARSCPQSLPTRDEQLFRAFRQRYDRLVVLVRRRPASSGCIDQIVSEHDYDLAVLAQHDGRRRYANLRKLGRLARSYEALRGRDVEGFVRFVFDRQSVGCPRDRGVRGGGGRRRGPAAHDPCGEGPRVPRRRRRGRGPRPAAVARRGDHLPP